MARKVLLATAALLAVLAVVVATRPGDYRVQRSIQVAAPPELVYVHLASFHRWESWSPWAKVDHGMTVEYGGPAAGPGATYSWKGSKDVGEGRMTILTVKPGARIEIHLQLVEPMKDEALTTFDLAPAGDGTRVTWSMAGKLGFFGKAVSLVSSMDRMVGLDFEKGLARLKAVVEEESQHTTATAP